VDGFPDGRISTGSVDPAQLAAARALAGTIADTAARTIITGMIDQQAAAAGGITIHIPRDQYALTARLTVPVSDIVFAALPAMEGAEGRVRAERLRVEAAESDVAFAAIEAFYRYVEARGVAAVAVSARDRAAALRDQIVRYADAGILGPADRAGAEARVAQAEEAVARTDAAVQVSGAALSILLGTPAGRAFSVASALPDEIPRLPGTLDAIETAALDHRPELRAAREALAAQARARDATIATGYPHLALYAYGEGSSPNQRVFPLRDEFIGTYELGATLTWSPNDTATALFRGDEMAAQIQAASDQMRLAEDGIRLEVRQAYEELRAAERSVEAARASAEAAEEAYRAQTAALAAGESILNDLLLADSRATDARLADLRARLAASLARARLAHAIGELSTSE
jgi:outer membrane protein TolC